MRPSLDGVDVAGARFSSEQLPDVETPAPDMADREALRQALLDLAPRQRAVVVLRYYEDLTERQTADALGISVGTVKSQARDALARLRTLVPEVTDPPRQCRAETFRRAVGGARLDADALEVWTP